jgi:hypothetical protein
MDEKWTWCWMAIKYASSITSSLMKWSAQGAGLLEEEGEDGPLTERCV